MGVASRGREVARQQERLLSDLAAVTDSCCCRSGAGGGQRSAHEILREVMDGARKWKVLGSIKCHLKQVSDSHELR
jgi:hypothetical protein